MMVAWMSGLVIGLQNRARRFESASDLKKAANFHQFAAFSLSIKPPSLARAQCSQKLITDNLNYRL